MTPSGASTPQSILVVEDDALLRQTLRDILEAEGYQVVVASGGLQALHTLLDADRQPSLILSDITMTDLNGYEFLEAVRTNEEWREIPFIFLSGQRERDQAYRPRDSGVVAFVTKPFAVRDLLAMIRRATSPVEAG